MLPSIAFRASQFAGGMCLIIAGCSESPGIREYVVARENQKDLTSELLRSEFPSIPFLWAVPEAWAVASNDQFSMRAWATGPATRPARITLGKFPAHTGVPAQVMRWRRQLGLKTDDIDVAMQSVTSLRTQNGAGSFATIEGENETILAFILPIESHFWIFRFKGPSSTSEATADLFRRFCQSLEYVQPSAKTSNTADGPNPSLSRPGPQEKVTDDGARSETPTSPDSDGEAAQSADESSADGD